MATKINHALSAFFRSFSFVRSFLEASFLLRVLTINFMPTKTNTAQEIQVATAQILGAIVIVFPCFVFFCLVHPSERVGEGLALTTIGFVRTPHSLQMQIAPLRSSV